MLNYYYVQQWREIFFLNFSLCLTTEGLSPHMYIIIFDMNFCYLDLEKHFAEIRKIEAAKRKLWICYIYAENVKYSK